MKSAVAVGCTVFIALSATVAGILYILYCLSQID
jgi:hypothetical protein